MWHRHPVDGEHGLEARATSGFDNLVRELVRRCRSFRKMRRKRLADFFDRFDQGVAEFFVFEMRAHSRDQPLPELFAALFVNRFVAHDGKLVRARRDKDEYGILLTRLVHAKPVKLFLCRDQWIDI